LREDFGWKSRDLRPIISFPGHFAHFWISLMVGLSDLLTMMLLSLVQKAAARQAVFLQHSAPYRMLSTTSEAVDKMHKLFNTQITNEMNASQLYLSCSIWCSAKELTGMASFMLNESNDERAHALELVDFALKRDIPVELEALKAPNAHWESPEDLWADCLEAEKTNSQALYNLATAAQECQDHAVTTFLHPFHAEQVDAVANMKTILAKVREESKTPGLIRQLDSQLEADAGPGIK
jgi:ferritin